MGEIGPEVREQAQVPVAARPGARERGRLADLLPAAQELLRARRRHQRSHQVAQRDGRGPGLVGVLGAQGDHGALRLVIDVDRRHPFEEAVVAVAEIDEQPVALLQSGRDPAEPHLARLAGDHLGSGEPRPQHVQRGMCIQRLARLERLRQLTWSGDALHPAPHGDDDVVPVVERVREVDARGDARPQLVADQPGKLEHRARFGRGVQVSLVRDALLVEGEHVGDGRPPVEQGDGEVGRIAGRQSAQRGELAAGESREHRVEERGVRADPVAQRREPRTTRHRERRHHPDAFAAPAGKHGHRPPRRSKLMAP